MNLIFHHDVPYEVQRLLLVQPVLSSITFTVNSSMLLLYCCRSTAGKAVGAVDVPESVIDVLTSLRDYLQDKCEPPIYVSDRRFMKALNLLQVAAYADGRDEVGIALRIMLHAGRNNNAGVCYIPQRCSVAEFCRYFCLHVLHVAGYVGLCHDRC